MADINAQNVILNAENFDMDSFISIFKEKLSGIKSEDDDFFQSDKQEIEQKDEQLELLNTGFDFVIDALNYNFEHLFELINLVSSNMIKAITPHEDELYHQADVSTSKAPESDDVKTEKGEGVSIFHAIGGFLAIAVMNMINEMFKGYEEGGFDGIIKSIFNPQSLFSKIGNYAIMGAVAGSFIPGIGTVVGGIIGAIFGFVLHFVDFGEVWDWVKEKSAELYTSITDSLGSVVEWFTGETGTGAETVRIFLEELWGDFTAILDSLIGLWKKIYIDTPKNIYNWIMENISFESWDSFKDSLKVIFIDKPVEFIDMMVDKVKGIWEWLTGLIKQTLDNLTGGIAGKIGGAVGGVWDWMTGKDKDKSSETSKPPIESTFDKTNIPQGKSGGDTYHINQIMNNVDNSRSVHSRPFNSN